MVESVPTEFRNSCTVNPDEEVPGQLASVRCVPGEGASVVTYTLFDTAASMDSTYTTYLGISTIGTDGGPGCDTGMPSEGGWFRQGNEDEDAGRLLCYTDPTVGGVIAWTDNDARILGLAYGREQYDAALYDFWTGAGPLPPE